MEKRLWKVQARFWGVGLNRTFEIITYEVQAEDEQDAKKKANRHFYIVKLSHELSFGCALNGVSYEIFNCLPLDREDKEVSKEDLKRIIPEKLAPAKSKKRRRSGNG